ncbi:MAG: methylmalonyl-CoA mutase family protein [Actinomycetota bacterium]|nr:methylmalonyl-CoA mutase family protein [Actinomycetota bacterium]
MSDRTAVSGRLRLETDGVTTGTREQWLAAAAGVLRKSGKLPAASAAGESADAVLSLLTSHTVEGLPVPALGAADTAGYPASRRGTATTDGWDIRVSVADPDRDAARAAVLGDLQGGSNSVWLTVGTAGTAAADLAFVLDGVLLDIAPVVLQATADAAYDAFGVVLRDSPVTPAAGTSFGADPIGGALRAGTAAELSSVADTAGRAAALGIGALVADASAAHDLGAGDAQELGWSLAVGVAYLRELEAGGIDPATAAGLIDFRYAVTDEQFVSIAKLRAARQLWARVVELSGLPADAQRQHAVTSRPMMTRYDPWVNMLRTTVAAFAAGAGGAQAVTVLPFDSALGVPDGFGRRIARNVSHLLIGESQVARVADPAGGSPAIEQLTAELAAAGWDEFGRLEQTGGATAALADGSFLDRIDAVRAQRDSRIATRRLPLTGVSEFPHLGEALPTRSPHPDDGAQYSWAAAFEALRDEPVATPVFLATIGPFAAHSTRAGFAANALAAGGIGVVTAGATVGVEDVLAGYRSAGTPVVCLAGTDAAYAERGEETIAALRAAGASTVLLAGKPAARLADQVDDQIAIGADIPALCRRIRGYLAGDTTGGISG